MSEYTPPSGPNPGPGPQAGPPPGPPSASQSAPTPPPAYPPREPPPLGAIPPDVSGKKIAAGICGILLGSLGIHTFILGYTSAGIIMLLVSIVTCGTVMWIIGIIEGILYLTKSDEEFYRTYIAQQRPWF